MPETTVNLNDLAQPGERHVWTARQVPPMKAEPKAEPVGQTAHHQFWTCVLASDTAHERAALSGGQLVHAFLHGDPSSLIHVVQRAYS